MSLAEAHDPTDFTCGTCGSEVVLKTQTMFTAAAPAGQVRSRQHICRHDPSHDLGPMLLESEGD